MTKSPPDAATPGPARPASGSAPSPLTVAAGVKAHGHGTHHAQTQPATPAKTVVGEPVTGAQSLVRSLEALGVEVVFGIPGGAILPAYDPLFDSDGAAHPGPARAGRRARRDRVRPGHRQGRRLHGHLRPGRDQPGHPDRRRLHGLGRRSSPSPARWPAARSVRTPSRRPTSRASRCRSPSTTSWSSAAEDIPRILAEAFHLAGTGRPGPVLVDIPKDVLQAQTDVQLAAHARPARLPADPAPARQADPRGGQADRDGPPAGALRRRRGAQGAAPRPQLRTLAELTGIPVVTTLMARGAFPDSHPQHLGMPGMHGTVARGLRAAEGRPAGRAGRPLRRPGHRQAGLFAPDAHDHPRRHRPGRDRQEPGRRRADRGRRQVRHRRADRRRGGRARGRAPGRPHRLVAPARRHAASATRWATTSRRRHPGPAVRDRAARRDRRPGRDLRRRRRPAPDVGGPVHLLREPGHLAQLRRPGHDGLRRAGGDGRQGRPAGHDGLGDRRRRLLPDDQPGAGHLRDRGHPDQGRRSSTTATWAWSGSGRRCSTTSATPTPTWVPTSTASPTS